jgi:hypothetical protein
MVYLATKYVLASAIVGGCSIASILRAIKTGKDRRHSNRIYQFLCRNVKDGQYKFRSSEAISAATNLPISRVADLCGKHGHIERKERERHMWRVGGSVGANQQETWQYRKRHERKAIRIELQK